MTATSTRPAANPSISNGLMIATYVVGGLGLFMSFYQQGEGNSAAAASWAAAAAVGGSGLLSFVRHSVFHRSDAARMHWDYGRRNDFQIEVGLANLSWGLVGIAAWALGWGASAEGAITIVFGLYILSAGALHASEIRTSGDEGGGRLVPTLLTPVFGGALVAAGIAAVNA